VCVALVAGREGMDGALCWGAFVQMVWRGVAGFGRVVRRECAGCYLGSRLVGVSGS
jgi:hypothetical protein